MLLSDDEIVRGCQKGFPESQRYLYIKYAPLLKGVCMRYVQDKELASDILHDCFIKIFDKIKKFKGEGSLEGWMKRIVVNTTLDHLRKTKKKSSQPISDYDYSSGDLFEEEYSNDEAIIIQLLETGYSKELLTNILTKLPQNYSTVFNLFYIDEISHREIANALQITESLSRKWAFRAKDQVKKQLIDYLKKDIPNTIAYGNSR